jgi:hypothetical protein
MTMTSSLLGTSNKIFVENNSCVFATGCNITVRSDMVRRTLICRLDPNMERPETRQFKRNPFKDVLADRGKYIGAAMTIARAYLAAGEPGGVATRRTTRASLPRLHWLTSSATRQSKPIGAASRPLSFGATPFAAPLVRAAYLAAGRGKYTRLSWLR